VGKRQFHDRSIARNRLEAEAVLLILEQLERGEIELVSSAALVYENGMNPLADFRMARPAELRRRELLGLGWKALVAELGVANATRFVLELSEGEEDDSELRQDLFAGRSVDEIYEEMRSIRAPEKRRRTRS
jgi:hypothetical protein